MEEHKKVIRTGIFFLALLGIGLGIYYFFVYRKSKEAVPAEEALKKRPPSVLPEEIPSEREKEIPELPPVELDKSDELVRQLVRELSSHEKLSLWLGNKDLIRRFTAAVDNIANGLSPRPQLEFLAPVGKFKVVKKGGKFYVDASGYDRYNLAVDVFDSFETENCAKLYRKLKPLFQEAYRDLGYPQANFDETLLRAVVELLKTPVVERDILLEKKVLTYMMADKRLESLSEAQKHLLRMGPENVQIIQAKLLELAQALGFPKDKLPQSITSAPERRRF